MDENQFPINAFTPAVSDYVVMLGHHNKINKNVVASSILNACGFVLSDIYEVSVKQGWIERSNLWTMISLPSGMGKSVIMRCVYQPIINYQVKLTNDVKKHNNLVKEWKGILKANKIKTTTNYLDENPELRNWLSKNNFGEESPEYKKYRNIFSDDFTFEKLISMLDENEGHGFLIRADEILGLFKMFNKYRKGNDEETLLKLWGYDAIKTDRKDEESNYVVDCPIISLIGATQKDMLFDIYTEDRKKNGNVFRFLFCLDDENVVKNVFDNNQTYDNILERFMNHYLVMFEGTKVNKTLPMDEGCNDYLAKWRNDCYDKYIVLQKMGLDYFNSIMGKMDSYIIRISIILNRLDNYYSQEKNNSIRIQDLMNAANIIDYYIVELMNILKLTHIGYHKFLKSDDEIDFYENELGSQQPYFDIIKKIENRFEITNSKANILLTKWQEVGLLKRNSKGIIYKKM